MGAVLDVWQGHRQERLRAGAWGLHGVEQSRQRRELDVPAPGVGLHLRAGARHRPHLDADGRDPVVEGKPRRSQRRRRRTADAGVAQQDAARPVECRHQRAGHRARGSSSAVSDLYRLGLVRGWPVSVLEVSVMRNMTPMNRILPLACAVWMLALYMAAPHAAQTAETAEGGVKVSEKDIQKNLSLFTPSENCV